MKLPVSPLICILALGMLVTTGEAVLRWRWYYSGRSGSSGRGWSPVRRNTNFTCDFPTLSCDKACDRLGDDLIGCCVSPPAPVSLHGLRNHNNPGASIKQNKTKTVAVAKWNSSASTTTTTMATTSNATTNISLPVAIPTSVRGDAAGGDHDVVPQLCYCCKIPANQIKYYPDLDYQFGHSSRTPKIIKTNIHPPKDCKGCKVVEITSLRFTFHETEKEKELRRYREEMNI